jgi:hypothetical protein
MPKKKAPENDWSDVTLSIDFWGEIPPSEFVELLAMTHRDEWTRTVAVKQPRCDGIVWLADPEDEVAVLLMMRADGKPDRCFKNINYMFIWTR